MVTFRSTFATTLALWLTASAAALGGPQDVQFVDASIKVDGQLLDWQLLHVPMEGEPADRLLDLVLVTRTENGPRLLQLYRQTKGGFRLAPKARTEVPSDAIAWTYAGGAGLLLRRNTLSASGFPDGSKPRDLASIELLFDVPHPDRLPYWKYQLPLDSVGDSSGNSLGDSPGDALLLPHSGGYRVLAADPKERTGPWGVIRDYPFSVDAPLIDPKDAARRSGDATRDWRTKEARLSRTLGESLPPFLGRGSSARLVAGETRVQAPALVDLNSDGHMDLVHWSGDRVRIYLGSRKEGLPEQPTRVELLPKYVTPQNRPAALRFADLNGDAHLDLLGVWGEKADVVENSEWRIMVLLASDDALLPAKPSQVLRFAAGELRVGVSDVDGDGHADLSVRQFEWPRAIQALTGLEFRYTHLLFRGEPRGGFTRRPTLRQSAKYGTTDVRAIFGNRDLSLDCSGDGIADLVEVALDGSLTIRQVHRDKGMFGGEKWRIDEEPFRRLSTSGSMTQLSVQDVNQDGIGDPITANSTTLTVFLSQREAKER